MTGAVRDWLSRHQVDESGLLGAQYGGAGFWLSPELVPRALLTFEGLVRVLRERGHDLRYERFEPGWGSESVILVARGARLELRMAEGLLRVPHVWSARERKYHANGGGEPARKWDHRPNGKLKLTVSDRRPRSDGKSWRDSSTRRLEERLGQVVLDIEQFAREVRSAQDQRQRLESEERARHLASVRAERMPIYWKWLRRDLRQMTSKWHEAQALREFIAQYEHAAGGSVDQNYVAMARRLAAEVDPLTSGVQVAKPAEPSDEFFAEVVEFIRGM